MLLFTSGFLAVQRFALAPFDALVCVLPLVGFLFCLVAGRRSLALSCLALSLAYLVDNGGEIYTETPQAIRLVIYLAACATLLLLSEWRIRVRALQAGALLVVFIAVGTAAGLMGPSPVFDASTLRRDAQVLLLLAVFLFPAARIELDLSALFFAGLGYLFGEVVNVALLYEAGDHYLSYNSLKAFVLVPVIVVLFRGGHLAGALVLASLTLPVMLLYGSRMLVASALALAGLASLTHAVRTKNFVPLGVFAALVTVAVYGGGVDAIRDVPHSGLKALSFFVTVVEQFDASDLAHLYVALDPVRFAEHQLVLARPWPELLFGSGLGSGVIDYHGLLRFVTYEQTAFSDDEIRSAHYFNFHDFWIDFGLRFGLVPVAWILWRLVAHEMGRGRTWRGVFFGLLLLNATFSSAGLIFTAMAVRFFPLASHPPGTR